MADRLTGKVALVSGGARGMGAAHARAMVAEGAKVVLGDILDDEGEVVAKELGDSARYVHLDVTRPDDWDAAVATAVSDSAASMSWSTTPGSSTSAPSRTTRCPSGTASSTST